MDLSQAQTIIAAAAAGQAADRWTWGRWDGARVHLDDSPDVGLVADNAAGPLAAGTRVYCRIAAGRVTILGPAAPDPGILAHLARLPRAMAAGEFRESFAGQQTSWIAFPPGRFTRPPIVTVTHADGAGATSWDAPRVVRVGATGFELLSRNGAGAVFHWIAVEF